MKFKFTILAITVLAAINCASSRKFQMIYCFDGSSYSPVGKIYTHSTLSLGPGLTFDLTDNFFDSKTAAKNNLVFKQEKFRGTVEYAGDTIKCRVEFPDEFNGSKYIFLNKGSKLILLNENGDEIQVWKHCH